MGTGDKEANSVMSRNKGDGSVITGARKIRHRQPTFPSVHRETWPANPKTPADTTDDSKTIKKRRVVKERMQHPKRQSNVQKQ